jgi:hypothetical protein
MSQIRPSLVPVLVDEVVEVELLCALVEESPVEVSDPAGTVVTSGWVIPPKLDAPPPPPQAVRALVSITASEARMGTARLAKTLADVTSRALRVTARPRFANSVPASQLDHRRGERALRS